MQGETSIWFTWRTVGDGVRRWDVEVRADELTDQTLHAGTVQAHATEDDGREYEGRGYSGMLIAPSYGERFESLAEAARKVARHGVRLAIAERAEALND